MTSTPRLAKQKIVKQERGTSQASTYYGLLGGFKKKKDSANKRNAGFRIKAVRLAKREQKPWKSNVYGILIAPTSFEEKKTREGAISYRR